MLMEMKIFLAKKKIIVFFLQQWDKYISPIAITYAYCLIPNHIHFLVQIKKEEEVLNLDLLYS